MSIDDPRPETPQPFDTTPPFETPLSAEEKAIAVVGDVVSGDFAAVTAQFDDAMREATTEQQLIAGWNRYRAEYGDFESHGPPTSVKRADRTVVSVPLRMARQEGEARVTFDGQGRISGVFFLKPGLPVP